MFDNALKIWVVAQNTLKESIRDKILYNIGAVGLFLVLFSIVLGDWSVFNREYVIKSFSLSVISFSGVLLAIFVGIGMVHKEIRKKTVLTLLSKPITRLHFILGKFIGLELLLTLQFAVISFMILLVLWTSSIPIGWGMVQAVILLWFQLGIIVSAAVLFSTFTTSNLAALFTFGVYIAGNLSSEILKQVEGMLNRGELDSGQLSGQAYIILSQTIYFVFPNLDQYNITGAILHSGPIGNLVMLKLMGFSMAYILVFLFISSWWFDRKDFI